MLKWIPSSALATSAKTVHKQPQASTETISPKVKKSLDGASNTRVSGSTPCNLKLSASIEHLAALISNRLSAASPRLPPSVYAYTRETRTSALAMSSAKFKTSPQPPLGQSAHVKQIWAVSRFIELLRTGFMKVYYDAYIGKGTTVSRSDAVRLLGLLPALRPHSSLAGIKLFY